MKHIKLSALFILLAFFIGAGSAFSQKMKAEDILAKHLESIGTAKALAAVKNQFIVGDAVVKSVTDKNPSVVGRIVLVSAGEKNFLGMSLNSVNYPREKFTYNGKDVYVGFVKVGQRSVLGNFVASSQRVFSESILGGVLSSSWALRNMANKKVKISFEGTKKIDGKEVYVLSYLTKGTDYDINLYFDKETFRHVRTEYKRSASAGIGARPEDSSGFTDTKFRITEDFSDFKTEKGLTLPHSYHILYSVSGGKGGTTEVDWNFTLNEFAFNQNLAANTFDADEN
ncbi:MAG: hypothetical protein M3033_04125 [Acidobacteriota bacterium]|nr:hypothetical protein [Acidobacteriota bacterium]